MKQIKLQSQEVFLSQEFYINYLLTISIIKTPKMVVGQANEEYQQIRQEYCQTRNQAKDILAKLKIKL